MVYMTLYQKIINILNKLADNYTWFSAVAMNGERGHERYMYNKYKNKNKN